MEVKLIMNKEFEKICKMSQASLKNHVRQKLQKTHGTVLNRDGFEIYIRKFFLNQCGSSKTS